MIRLIGLIVAAVGAVAMLITGFEWFGASTDHAIGWLGLFAVGVVLVLASADLDAAVTRRRGAG